ncbi:MAG: dihydroneopterin aldolase [Bacteroidales bacterium]|nr:dihydroneopterin aldolase [Bacteroidales bacterium]
MSLISIEGMEFFSHHGHFKEEQIIGTKFIVDFHLTADTSKAEESDELSKTVNYAAVYRIIKKEMEQKSYLLEHVAHRCLNKVLGAFPDIFDAKIKICKLNPTMGGKVQKVCVTLSTKDIQP